MNYVGEPRKATLQKKPIGAENVQTWLITTSVSRQVVIFGALVENANFSTWTGSTSKKEKVHTVYLNGCTDEMAEQYKQHAGGTVFYLIINPNPEEPIVVLTPSEYKEAIDNDELQPVASLNASSPA
jgi:hypothetical protein